MPSVRESSWLPFALRQTLGLEAARPRCGSHTHRPDCRWTRCPRKHPKSPRREGAAEAHVDACPAVVPPKC
jgi:hypothetical protein